MSSKKSVIGLLAGLLFVAASDCPWKLGLSKLAPRLFSPSFSPRSTRKLSAWRRRDFLIKFKWLWGEVKSIELFFSREVLFFPSCFGGNRFFKGIYVRIDVAEIRVNISAFVEKFLVSRIKETRERRKF